MPARPSPARARLRLAAIEIGVLEQPIAARPSSASVRTAAAAPNGEVPVMEPINPLGYRPADELGSVLRGRGGSGMRRRLKDARPEEDERGLMGPAQVSPGSARALVGGVPVNVPDRRCPACGNSLRPRQRVCSGRCRAELSRRRQAQLRHARDQQIRELLVAALALMGRDGPP